VKLRHVILASFLFALCHAQAQLRVPAFTAYLEPDPDGASISSPSGISDWTDPSLKVLWFGDVKNPGKLDCSLELRLQAGALQTLGVVPSAAAAGLFLSPAKPKQAVKNKPVLGFTFKSRGEIFVGLMLVINIVVPHVEIDHAVALIRPDDGIITLMPDFVGLRPRPKRVTRRIN
jgi:hypothetical protein